MYTELMNAMQYGKEPVAPKSPYPRGMNPLDPMHQLAFKNPPPPRLHQMMADIGQYGGQTVRGKMEAALQQAGAGNETVQGQPLPATQPQGETIDPAAVRAEMERRAREAALYQQQQAQQRMRQEEELRYLESRQTQDVATQRQLQIKEGGRKW